MMTPRYSIGIDLGTTNCALAYLDLTRDVGESEVLGIRQLETRSTDVQRSTLPSFLYLEEDGQWSAGLFARERGREQPDRVVHSAKSWLCHHTVSPQAKILPWKSKAITDADKLSAIEASSHLLEVLKNAWDSQFGNSAPFEQQGVTITVPASFDAAAQAATLEAARAAGYPDNVRLIEEPQAAFYRWLETAEGRANELREGECILVVDIGGGTSDFSLFRIGGREKGRPKIVRVSVSEHLLLGGDNIDLALAHALESELAPDGEDLSVDQWAHLISRARDLKEACLVAESEEDRSITVSVPSKGSGLIAGTLSTEVSASLARELILEGFFPECKRGSRAERSAEGLLEIGLPYATDCGVTRHLAEFLDGCAGVDRVLFNGGSLSSSMIQDRLLSQISQWQESRKVVALENSETDLAVARGAAFYGAQICQGRRRIDAGAARAIFIEVASESETKHLCVLPKGAQPGEQFDIEIPGLRMAVNQIARFRVFQGRDSMQQSAGEWCKEKMDTMRSLPPLDTRVEFEGRESILIRLKSGVSELGMLTVNCESLDESVPGSWPLAFNLRAEGGSAGDLSNVDPGLDAGKVAKASRSLKRGFLARGTGLKASRVFKELEADLRMPKYEWNLRVCRALVDEALENCEIVARSPEVAETWLQLVGYLMRPGFGAPGDDARLVDVFEVSDTFRNSPVKVEVQFLILLRRIAPGLSDDQQVALFGTHLSRLGETKRGEAERIRLLGSLEKLELRPKECIYDSFVQRLDGALSEGKAVAPLLGGLASLLSRVLFDASVDRVLPPDTVEGVFDRLRKQDWSEGRFADAVPLFLKAARVVDERALNISRHCSAKIVSKLEKSGVSASRLLPLRDYVPVTQGERALAYGEALPPGFLLTGGN
ncbi:Hsp70 family protein [Pelagicoccus sp. SDUM812002]|uniref:hsp70 family protein n=1 Tax=Pelagicoccus sp. SDUM812002 TaxID=3041266 RepID=UPI00280F4CAE|nr:Hsp70 family protein [Pelagicoccus sp. SDUM812002]MDQ8187239.1 Hsp70 family protein [Pelagicoccus sp. SDUM812002]